jgi:lipopolysaccharide/colanic/teichoic acid biosynthesis glycosyltransferase
MTESNTQRNTHHTMKSSSVTQNLSVNNLPASEYALIDGKIRLVPTSSSRYLEILLSFMHIALYTLAYGAISAIISQETLASWQDPLFIGSNILFILALSLMLEYTRLHDSCYSLGKALVMGTGLWLFNSLLVVTHTQSFSSWLLLEVGGIFSLFALLSAWIQYHAGQPFSRRNTQSHYYQLEQGFKRGIDFTASLLGLLILSPLLLFVAIIIQLESKGSSIYKQTRIGKHEQKFQMYKFRSMVIHADQLPTGNITQLYKAKNDPRVTRIGKVIRKLSLDELPQLWNVLKGDMSLIGPRPPIEREYHVMNAHHKRKFEVTPGLTGLWQITGRMLNERHFNAVASYDVKYLTQWSLMDDLKILVATIPVVLFQKGAC